MITKKRTASWLKWTCGLVLTVLAGAAVGTQAHFPTPDAAVQALIDAAGAQGSEALYAVLGPDSSQLGSGDPAIDDADRQAFVEAAAEQTRIEQKREDFALLIIGNNDWPFPIPLVRDPSGWHFDTAAGEDELVNRRIGRNELYAIAVARAFVDAQYEYAAQGPGGEGVREFARKLRSSAGKHDGLYWPAGEGEPQSPLGPFVAGAVAEGYVAPGGDSSVPYYGYFFRPLQEQGPHAPGGAKSYLNDGRMTEGFALLAYPAEYGVSGVMSFIVNQQGIVFQKDLGEDTSELAAAIQSFDPDATWSPVRDDGAA